MSVDERDYLLLRAAQGIIDHRKPRRFRLYMNAYEWTFNLKIVAPDDLSDVASIIYLAVNGRLDIDAESNRLATIINEQAKTDAAKASAGRERSDRVGEPIQSTVRGTVIEIARA